MLQVSTTQNLIKTTYVNKYTHNILIDLLIEVHVYDY